MSHPTAAAAVRGKTIRVTWLDGPTRGKVHEHVFHPDGTVEWHDAGSSKPASGGKAERPPERSKRQADPRRSPAC